MSKPTCRGKLVSAWKLRISAAGLLSSIKWKSACFRSVTRLPVLSVTVNTTFTSIDAHADAREYGSSRLVRWNFDRRISARQDSEPRALFRLEMPAIAAASCRFRDPGPQSPAHSSTTAAHRADACLVKKFCRKDAPYSSFNYIRTGWKGAASDARKVREQPTLPISSRNSCNSSGNSLFSAIASSPRMLELQLGRVQEISLQKRHCRFPACLGWSSIHRISHHWMPIAATCTRI